MHSRHARLLALALTFTLGLLLLAGCGTSTPPPSTPPAAPKSTLSKDGPDQWYFGPGGTAAAGRAKLIIDNGLPADLTITLPDQKSFVVKSLTRVNLILEPGAGTFAASLTPLAAPEPAATASESPPASPLHETVQFTAGSSGIYVYNPAGCWDYLVEMSTYGSSSYGYDHHAESVQVHGTPFFKITDVHYYFQPFPQKVEIATGPYSTGSVNRWRIDHLAPAPLKRTINQVALAGLTAWVCNLGKNRYVISTTEATTKPAATLYYDPAGDPANLSLEGVEVIRTGADLTTVHLSPGTWHFSANLGSKRPAATTAGRWLTGARRLWCPSGSHAYQIDYQNYAAYSLGSDPALSPERLLRGLTDVAIPTRFAFEPFPNSIAASSQFDLSATSADRFDTAPPKTETTMRTELTTEFTAAVANARRTINTDKLALYDQYLSEIPAPVDDLTIQFANALAADFTNQPDAESLYKDLDRFDPPWIRYHLCYAEWAVKHDQLDIAMTQFRRVSAIDPSQKAAIENRIAAVCAAARKG